MSKGPPLDKWPAHHSILSEHLTVRYLAQEHLGSALKVYWHLPLLTEHFNPEPSSQPSTPMTSATTPAQII